MKLSIDFVPALVQAFLRFGLIPLVLISAGSWFVWLSRCETLGPDNRHLMLGGALIACGFAAWRSRRVKYWHLYRHVYGIDWWALTTVFFWLAVAFVLLFATVTGRIPMTGS